MASVLIRKIQPYSRSRERVLRIRQTAKRIGLKGVNTDASLFRQSDVQIEIGNGEKMVFSSGKMAKFADGCASVSYKDTTVIATVVSKDSQTRKEAFVPLTVSYQQKAAALGRIPLNFLRREIGQTEQEVLTSRMIDRSIRPLFPEGFCWDTQVICNPLAMDGSNYPDVLGINAASAALAVSNVPWNGPVGAVRVGWVGGKCILYPTKRELADSELNLVMTARNSKVIVMIEAVASSIVQSNLFTCLKTGVKECNKVVSGILALQKLCGKEKRTLEPLAAPNPKLVSEVESLALEKIKHILQDFTHDKTSRDLAIFGLRDDVLNTVKEKFGDEAKSASGVFNDLTKRIFRDLIFDKGIRCDGRTLKELRKMACEVDLYKPLHGSALFQRGQTQVFCTVALDSPNSALKMDKISMATSGLKEKNFFVHYEFPPFATNETGRLGPIGRREIGHGILAEKALQSNIPPNYPFTIRLTSEVLESNGSSSMATVCCGSLALMDAGVPLIAPCAGVAMGFISKSDENGDITDYRILTDLLGIEDYLGEMDFKIAGTKKAYTALQLDVKNSGVPLTIIYEILNDAKDALGEILSLMRETCRETRRDRKPNWPQKQIVKVSPHLRYKFLGPGGINVKKMEMTTGVELMEEIPGEFILFAPNTEAMNEANEMIKELLKTYEDPVFDFGGVYAVVITELKESGCMVRLHPNMNPVHVPLSQLDVRQVRHPSALGLQVGQEIKVKFFGRDPISGAIRLSRKVLMGPASEVARTFVKSDQLGEAISQEGTIDKS